MVYKMSGLDIVQIETVFSTFVCMRILAIIIVVVLVGCGPNIVFEQAYDVGEEWSYEEQMDFDIHVVDTSMLYDLQFLLGHSVDYTFQNLYVKITTTYPSGKKVEDELSLQMANKMGEFSGQCSREHCTLTVVLQERFRFQEAGDHRISIAQHSRMEVLQGIESGELRLVESEVGN